MANTLGSNNPFPSVLFAEHVDPANPSAGTQRLFVDTDHLLKLRDSSGTVVTYPTSSGGTGTLSTVREVDSSPTDSAVTELVFPNGTLAIASHVATYTPSAGGATGSEAFITSDVSIPSANTFVDGPSSSLAAGTYIVMAKVLAKTPVSAFITGKLWDGTTVFDTAEQYQDTAGGTRELVTVAYVVLGSTTTVKMSIAINTAAGGAGTIMATAATNGTTNKATKIVALRIS